MGILDYLKKIGKIKNEGEKGNHEPQESDEQD